MKILLIASLAASCVSMAAAQTTEPDSAMAAANETTAAISRSDRFTSAAFEERWSPMELRYRAGGLDDEIITKLKSLDEKVWSAQQRGERMEFAKIARERKALLSPEELQKFEQISRQQKNRRPQPDQETTATADTDNEETTTPASQK